MSERAQIGDWYIEQRAQRAHKVLAIPGSKGQIAETVCGRYVGPLYGDIRKPEAHLDVRKCANCVEGRRKPRGKKKARR